MKGFLKTAALAGAAVFCWAVVSAASLRADAFDRGRALFEPCRACHARVENAETMPGPNLFKLNGRRVGGDKEFDYSPVLKRTYASGALWDEKRLLAFLADPEEMFPAMWMSARGIASEADRRALAAYLLQDGP